MKIEIDNLSMYFSDLRLFYLTEGRFDEISLF